LSESHCLEVSGNFSRGGRAVKPASPLSLHKIQPAIGLYQEFRKFVGDYDGQAQNPRFARLHGSPPVLTLVNRQSGPVLEAQASALLRSLETIGVELICPTSPHQILATDAWDTNGKADGWYSGWCNMDEDKQEMRGLDASIAALGKLMEEEVYLFPNHD
jgi:hypothetical protein